MVSGPEISSDAYTVSGYDADTAGDQNITVTYAGKTDTFMVTVNGEPGTEPEDPVLERIEVTTLPDTTEYKIGDTLDLTGMVVTAYYSNDESEEVTDYTVEGFDSSAAGPVELTVRYEDKTAVFTVTVTEDTTEPGGEDPEDPDQPGGEDPEDPNQPGEEDPSDPGQTDGDVQDPDTGSQGGQDTDNSVNDKTDNSSSGQAVSSPKTGDGTNFLLWTGLATAALVAGGYAEMCRKKSTKR